MIIKIIIIKIIIIKIIKKIFLNLLLLKFKKNNIF